MKISRKIWQPESPTPGWLLAAEKSDLTVMLPHENGDVPMFFQRIPATGADGFRMGARGYSKNVEPIHRVVISQDFYLGTFPVTQAQYRVMAEGCLEELSRAKHNRGIDPSEFKGYLRPVEHVSWDDARKVVFWLMRSNLLPPGWRADLPCEAMWEYGCRAGAENEYWSGDGEAALAEVDWYRENSGNETHPVGELRANPFGLYDLHGNVFEWCADVWDERAYRKRPNRWQGVAWDEDDAAEDAEYIDDHDKFHGASFRVVRGGSWECVAGVGLSAYRREGIAYENRSGYGFRICLFPDPINLGKAMPDGQRPNESGRGEIRETRDNETCIPGGADLEKAYFSPPNESNLRFPDSDGK